MSILKKIFRGICDWAYSAPGLCALALGWGTAIIMGTIFKAFPSENGILDRGAVVVLSILVAIFGTRFFVHWSDVFDLQEDNPSMSLKTAWKETRITKNNITKRYDDERFR